MINTATTSIFSWFENKNSQFISHYPGLNDIMKEIVLILPSSSLLTSWYSFVKTCIFGKMAENLSKVVRCDATVLTYGCTGTISKQLCGRLPTQLQYNFNPMEEFRYPSFFLKTYFNYSGWWQMRKSSSQWGHLETLLAIHFMSSALLKAAQFQFHDQN